MKSVGFSSCHGGSCALYFSLPSMHVWLFTFQGKKVNFSILNFTLSDILMKTTLETRLRCIIVMCTNKRSFLMKAKDLSSRCIRAQWVFEMEMWSETINTFVVWTRKPKKSMSYDVYKIIASFFWGNEARFKSCTDKRHTHSSPKSNVFFGFVMF